MWESILEKIGAKQYTLQDLERAKRSPERVRQFNLKAPGPKQMTGQERELVRRLAEDTFALMQSKGTKMTFQDWFARLVKVYESRRPEIRERLLAELDLRYKAK